MTRVRFTDALSERQQAEAEDMLCSLLYENSDLDDEKAYVLAQQALAIVLLKFRPDLAKEVKEEPALRLVKG